MKIKIIINFNKKNNLPKKIQDIYCKTAAIQANCKSRKIKEIELDRNDKVYRIQ